MNRPIKFRAWSYHSKKMLEWSNILERRDFNLLIEDKNLAYIFMQFTGLHDKNGNEIYEGDIVAMVAPIQQRIVTFNKGRFVAERIGEPTTHYGGEKNRFVQFSSLAKSVEVVGNVYENSELLTRITP